MSPRSAPEPTAGCVEVASAPGIVGVRDSKLGTTSPALTSTPDEWAACIAGVEHGEFAARP